MFGENRIFLGLRVLLLFILHYWQRVKYLYNRNIWWAPKNQAVKISITNNRANWHTPPEDLQWEIPKMSMLTFAKKYLSRVPDHKETIWCPGGAIQKDNWSGIFKNVNVKKTNKNNRWGDCSKWKETKELWQTSAKQWNSWSLIGLRVRGMEWERLLKIFLNNWKTWDFQIIIFH